MYEVPMAAPASAVHEPGSLQLSDAPSVSEAQRATLFILEANVTGLAGQGTTHLNNLSDVTLDPLTAPEISQQNHRNRTSVVRVDESA